MTRRLRPRDPRGHWILVLLAIGVLAGLLFLHGYSHSVIGETRRTTPASGRMADAPQAILDGGPVLNLAGATPQSAKPRRKTLALTFDDGPDPAWTPRLLDVLGRHNAKATFFLVGARVGENPALTRRIIAEGHEIGSHTYAHADLAHSPSWRIWLELTLTQEALAGAAGIQTRLLRPPYTSTPSSLAPSQWASVQEAGRQGYIIALASHDTKDWARPGVDRIVADGLPSGGRGAVVMLHDSGGDRGQTVAAVDRLLGLAAEKGYQAVTLTSSLGLPSAHAQARTSHQITGNALVLAQRAATWTANAMGIMLTICGALTVARIVLFVFFAHVHASRARRRGRRHRGTHRWDYPPAVSVIVPAYNEAAGIVATLRSLLDTDYPGRVEVIVVDDGSIDDTYAIASSVPGIHVLRQANGGKPAALNTGIRTSRHDILIMVDGDTVFERSTISRLVGPLAAPDVGAVAGNTKVGNRRGLLGRWQHIEYVIGFNLDRRAFDLLGCMPTVPGAVGAFRRTAVASVGGVSPDTLAEDTDLTMALRRDGWRVVYEETARAWTEAPSSLAQLWRQRYRWCYGTLQAMWKHGRALNSSFGRRCLGYLWVFHVLLPMLAPVVDVSALYGLAFGDPFPVVGVWLLFVVLQALTALYALRLDGERYAVIWVLPLQQFIYRQLMYLVVIHSVVTAMIGVRLRWHVSRREGTFQPRAPAARAS